MAKVSFDFHDEAKWFEVAKKLGTQHFVFEVTLDGYIFNVHWFWRDDAVSGFDFAAELAWDSAYAFEGKRYKTTEELIRETRKHIGQRVLEFEREEQLANETEVSRVMHLMERVALRRAGKAQWEARKRAEQKALEDRERHSVVLSRLSSMSICLVCGNPMGEFKIEEEEILYLWNDDGVPCYVFQCPICKHRFFVTRDPQ